MAFSSSLAAWPSSSCCSTSRSRCARNRTAAPSQPVAGIAALPRRQHNISISADLQQHSLGQHLPALAAPKQQQPHWCMQQQQQQLQSNSQQSRCAVVAAAGRRRRTDVGAEEEDPDLDMDDVMYADGDDDDDGAILEETRDDDDDAAEFEEFEEDEEDEDEYDLLDEGDGEEAPPGEEDDWAAALDEFDTAQDAQVNKAPSKEEQELEAAKAMVRFDEGFAEEDGTSLIVSEVPPEEPDRPKTFDEQTVELSPQDKQTLEQNMASYTVFPMHELDLLVSSTPDGQLVLSDCFCLDTVEESFVRPTVGERIPREPRMYQIIPWEHTKTGDFLKHIEPDVSRMKLYFIGLHTVAPHEVDMTRIYSFDADTLEMVSHTPKVLGADSHENMLDPVMRIREDGVFIEEAATMPGSFFIAEGFAGHPEERYNNPDKPFDMYEFVKMGMWDKPRSMEELLLQGAAADGSSSSSSSSTAVATTAGTAAAAAASEEEGGSALDTLAESQLEERLEELELMEELDDMPDVPAVDMM